jgi:hypothetical protein
MIETYPLRWSAEWDESADSEFSVRFEQFGSGLISGEMHPTLGAPNQGRSYDLDCLAAFIDSLALPERTHALTLAEQRGKAIFESPETGCASCHPAPLYTDLQQHDVGTADGDGEWFGPEIDTPTLRFLYDSAPYLHDGSTDVLGSVLVRQSSARTPTLPDGTYLDFGTGHVGDIYHLATLEEALEYRFGQDGDHTIVLEGHVQDVYGNLYPIDVTYDVTVANILDLDPAQLPTTPCVQGDAFAPGLHVFPPVPAEVSVTLVQMPYSDPSLAFTTTVTGVANRFGYFQPPPGTAITMEAPGELSLLSLMAAMTGCGWGR